MISDTPFAFRGTFVHAPEFGKLQVLQDTVCIVSGRRSGGRILAIVPAAEADNKMEELGLQITVHKIPVIHSRMRRCSCVPLITSFGSQCAYKNHMPTMWYWL